MFRCPKAKEGGYSPDSHGIQKAAVEEAAPSGFHVYQRRRKLPRELGIDPRR